LLKLPIQASAFWVQAYNDTQLETVTVQEGAVEFKANNSKITLHAQQTAAFDYTKQVFTTIETANRETKNANHIFFNNIDLKSAAIILENRFDKKIILKNQALAERRIYGKFEQGNLSEILQAISLALDIQYAIKGKEIVLQER